MQNLIKSFLITPRAHNEHVKVDRRRAAMTMEDFMGIFSKIENSNVPSMGMF